MILLVISFYLPLTGNIYTTLAAVLCGTLVAVGAGIGLGLYLWKSHQKKHSKQLRIGEEGSDFQEPLNNACKYKISDILIYISVKFMNMKV